jgi:hypothetical protein
MKREAVQINNRGIVIHRNGEVKLRAAIKKTGLGKDQSASLVILLLIQKK